MGYGLMCYILIWGHLSVRGFKWSKCLVQLPRHTTNHIFSIDNLSENPRVFHPNDAFSHSSVGFFQNSSGTLQWQSPLAKSLHLSDQCLMIGDDWRIVGGHFMCPSNSGGTSPKVPSTFLKFPVCVDFAVIHWIHVQRLCTKVSAWISHLNLYWNFVLRFRWI